MNTGLDINVDAAVYHIRAEYPELKRLTGQDVRANGVVEILLSVLHRLGLNTQVYMVRLRNPTRRTESQADVVQLPLCLSTKIMRATLLKPLRRFPYLKARLEWQFMLYRAKVDELVTFMMKDKSKLKIILFDDITSISVFGDKDLLKLHSCIRDLLLIYNSHNYYVTAPNKLREMERNFMTKTDMVFVASLRDKHYYEKSMGHESTKLIVIPNCFPPSFFLNDGHYNLLPSWEERKRAGELRVAAIGGQELKVGKRLDFARNFLETSLRGLRSDVSIQIYAYGNLYHALSMFNIPQNVRLVKCDAIPDRSQFLQSLSRAHIGINYTYKLTGSNTKRFDYALAGLVVISNCYGAKGEPLPHEYVFIDEMDLRAKIEWCADRLESLDDMGRSNHFEAIRYAKEAVITLEERLRKHLGI